MGLNLLHSLFLRENDVNENHAKDETTTQSKITSHYVRGAILHRYD